MDKMSLITGSLNTLSLLDELMDNLVTSNSDIERKDRKYWCACRSKSKKVAFAYLQPTKNQIRIFPRVKEYQIQGVINKTSLKINVSERRSWGKEYKYWFKISKAEEIEEAIKILQQAYRFLIEEKKINTL